MPLSHFNAHRARIAWISSGVGPDLKFRKAFRDAQYGLSDLKDERFADVAIVDLRQAVLAPANTRKLASAARRAAPHGGIVYLASPLLDAAHRAYLRRSGSLVLTDDNTDLLIEACRERIRRRNLAEEAGERVKSFAETGALRPIREPAGSKPPYHVLVAGKPSPSTLSVLSAARAANYHVEGVLSPSQALNAIETNRFDCAVFLPDGPSDPLYALSRRLRHKNSRADFPVLLVTGNNDSGALSLPLRLAETDLGDYLARLIKRSKQTKLIRSFLDRDAHNNVLDRQTGAVTASFFARHAARLLARAEETERTISFAAIELDAVPFAKSNATDISEPLTDASTLINSTLRKEDMLARIAPTTFIVTFTATVADDAERIAHRIAGILQNTMFKMRDPAYGENMLFAITAATSVIDNTDDLCLEEMIARLLGQIKSTANKASKAS